MALTGDEFLVSLEDGRNLYLDGERVQRLAEHPGFAGGARTIAALYDSLHGDEADPALFWTT